MTVVPFRRAGTPAPRHDSAPRSDDRAIVVTAEGRRIAYAEAGAGPDVLLIHGTLTMADDMRLGPMELLARDHHCVAVDRPGHGWSDHVRGADASLWSQMETIRGAVRALGLRRPVICGHSYGSAVALAYAIAHPDEIGGVVAVAPICFPELRLEQLLFGGRALPMVGDALSRMLGATLDPVLLPILWRTMFLPQTMPERFAAAFPFDTAGRPEQVVTEGENASLFWPDLARSALGYPGLRVPVHILCGSADIVVNSFAQGLLAAALIPGARSTLLPGIGHMLHHARPDAVATALRTVSAG